MHYLITSHFNGELFQTNNYFYSFDPISVWQNIHISLCLCVDYRPTNTLVHLSFNTLRPRQNGRHFPDDIFKLIFLNENLCILIETSLKFVPVGPINNIPALVHIMAWRRPGDKPLSEPMMVSLLTHISVTRPQWVKPRTKTQNAVPIFAPGCTTTGPANCSGFSVSIPRLSILVPSCTLTGFYGIKMQK